MAETQEDTGHDNIPSGSVQMSTDNAGAPGQTSTVTGKLEKTKSQKMMESHAVEAHLLKELWYVKDSHFLNIARGSYGYFVCTQVCQIHRQVLLIM